MEQYLKNSREDIFERCKDGTVNNEERRNLYK